MIWQTMMGSGPNPKLKWDVHDDEWQHFSDSTGRQFEGRICPKDRLVIYWPGKKLYMGISVAAERGPYRLNMFGEEWDQVKRDHPDVVSWPYGMRVRDLLKIPDPRNGVTLNEARQMVPNLQKAIVRKGCQDVTGWKGIENLIALIRQRA